MTLLSSPYESLADSRTSTNLDDLQTFDPNSKSQLDTTPYLQSPPTPSDHEHSTLHSQSPIHQEVSAVFHEFEIRIHSLNPSPNETKSEHLACLAEGLDWILHQTSILRQSVSVLERDSLDSTADVQYPYLTTLPLDGDLLDDYDSDSPYPKPHAEAALHVSFGDDDSDDDDSSEDS